jgi:hypothetical protein
MGLMLAVLFGVEFCAKFDDELGVLGDEVTG